MPNTMSPNMGLIVPTVGQEPGPTWATDLNASLSTIDQHNHSSGQGVKISPLGMDINIDLNIQNNNLTQLKTINFTAQGSFIPGVSPNLGCLYVAGNELYYNDESGNVVPLTNNGSVNSGAGSITGLPSGTASASYSSGTQTFVWQSATSTPANMDNGAVIIREVAANAKGVKLNSPSSLAADYSLFFPAALPSAQKIVTIDSSGNIAANYVVDNSTIEVSSNVIQVKNAGITAAKLAPGAAATNLGPLVYAQSANSNTSATSSTTFITIASGLTVTLTTTGNPVQFMVLTANPAAGGSFIRSFTGQQVEFLLRNNTTSTDIGQELLEGAFNPSSSLVFVEAGLAAGTYTWELLYRVDNGGNTVELFNSYLFAYELR